ncbi:MAG TPA: MlaD family protein [Candidatus Binatia bacterium]|nr:MlaD family protein [Candidatus Binatia bacterium]
MSRSKRASPTLIGAFVIGALLLALGGLAVFGSGKLFRRTEQFVAIFSGSVNGLSVGAPVKFRGVQVGSVTSILLGLPGMTLPDLRIPVFFDIDRDTTLKLGAMVNPANPSALAALIDQGLRAQLQLESIVTGVLFVELDLFPNSQVTLFLPKNSGYVEIPTQPTLLQEATQTAADVVAKLRDADIDGLVNAVRDAARGVDELAGSPELRQTLVAIRDALTTTRETLVEVKPRIAPLAGRFDTGVARLETTLDRLDQTLGSVKASLGSFDTLVDPQAPLVYQLTTTLADLGEAARSIRQFADYLDRNPNALFTGRPKQ